MPARISAQDFRDYIKQNFALEGGKELKDVHIRGLEKAMRGHAKMGGGYHAPGLSALRYGKKAEAISEQRAFSLTKNLRDAVQKGEIQLDGKKIEIAHDFRGVTGQGELRQSIRGIAEAAAKRAAPPEPTKEEVDSQKVAAGRRRAIADQIIQRNIDATRPGSAAVTSVFDSPKKAGAKTNSPDTSSLHSIPKVVSVGDFNAKTQMSVGQPAEPRPMVSGAGQAAVGEIGKPTHEPTTPADIPDDTEGPIDSTPPAAPDTQSDESPPPPADDELPI